MYAHVNIYDISKFSEFSHSFFYFFIYFIFIYLFIFCCGAATQRGSWPPHS